MATSQNLDFQVTSVVASSRPLSRPFHPSQTVTSPRVGGFEHSAAVGGKAPFSWPTALFHLLCLEQQHSTQFCQAGQEVKKKVQEKLYLPEIEISARKDVWGKEGLEDKSGYSYAKGCSDFS